MGFISSAAGGAWQIVLDSAPWLLLGIACAGVIRAWLPTEAIARLLGRPGIGSILRAALVGTPLPLCSCGVIPAAVALRRRGASSGATVSFLIATPENGADSIVLSYALLGPIMAVLRPLAAVASAVVAGLMADSMVRDAGAAAFRAASDHDGAAAACAGQTESTAACCCPDAGKSGRILGRTLEGLRYAFVDLWDDLAGWLVLGMAIAAGIGAVVPAGSLAGIGDGLPAMLSVAAVGIPMYVCATSSTPIAAAMIHAGVSPGAALVFLLVGPATNVATILAVRRELGGRGLAAYLVGLVGTAIGFGVSTDMVLARFGLGPGTARAASCCEVPGWLAGGSAAVLIAMLGGTLVRRVARRRG